MASNTFDQYTQVLRAVKNAVHEYRINERTPARIISDFELGIINSAKTVFPGVPIRCCFFHLGQSLYRKIQDKGLQVAYNDLKDRTIKEYTRMILALAYVPLAHFSVHLQNYAMTFQVNSSMLWITFAS